MIPQVNSICKSAFYQLQNIAHIRKYLSPKTTEFLDQAFVSSKLGFSCNSLLYGIPKYLLWKLQSVQNAAVHLVAYFSKFDHVCPLLHWIAVAYTVFQNGVNLIILFIVMLIGARCLDHIFRIQRISSWNQGIEG